MKDSDVSENGVRGSSVSRGLADYFQIDMLRLRSGIALCTGPAMDDVANEMLATNEARGKVLTTNV